MASEAADRGEDDEEDCFEDEGSFLSNLKDCIGDDDSGVKEL